MNKDSKQESRCCAAPPQKDHRQGVCPVNGQKGQPVETETLRHLIKAPKQNEIRETGYYFCKSSDCGTVYYHPESGQRFDKTDLIVRVGLKETEDPVWVCYCFDISQKMIREELEHIGRSSYGDRIRREVAAGHCKCEILNPSGRCCLGEVLAAEKEARSLCSKCIEGGRS